jgi:hypothetical protein
MIFKENFSVLEYGVLPTGLDRFAAELAVKLRFTFTGYMLLHKIARAVYGVKEIYFIVKKNITKDSLM